MLETLRQAVKYVIKDSQKEDSDYEESKSDGDDDEWDQAFNIFEETLDVFKFMLLPRTLDYLVN